MSISMKRGPLARAPSLIPVVATCAVLLALTPKALASTFTPNKLNDHAPHGCTASDCTLREAVIRANHHHGSDKIVLKGGKTYNLSHTGATEGNATSGDLDILGSLRVTHSGHQRATIDANGIDRVFHVPASTTASTTLSGLIIRGGATLPTDNNGGGILAESGALVVVDSVVSGNTTDGGAGGGIDVEAPVAAKILRTSVNGNFAGDSGGGVFTAGHTLIKSSTVSDNKTDGGGGVFSIGTLILKDDTVADNRAYGRGGGIGSFGTARLNSVTVARNVADSDGSGGAAGGGLAILGGTVAVANSLIALNMVGTGSTDPNCSGGFDSGGHNLRTTSDTGCAGFTATGDLVNSNPKIGFVADNGGPTQTIALQSGSPAIGHADSATAEARDQRGVLRDNHPDIGAFERR